MEFLSPKIKAQIDQLQQENAQLKSDLQEVRSKYGKGSRVLFALSVILAITAVFILIKSRSNPAVEVSLWRNGSVVDTVLVPEMELVYTIQLSALKDSSVAEMAYGFEELALHEVEGYMKLTLGRYKSLPDAQRMLNVLAHSGLEKAYIVAYKDDIAVGLLSNKTAIKD